MNIRELMKHQMKLSKLAALNTVYRPGHYHDSRRTGVCTFKSNCKKPSWTIPMKAKSITTAIKKTTKPTGSTTIIKSKKFYDYYRGFIQITHGEPRIAKMPSRRNLF
jgi:hypothetical protein